MLRLVLLIGIALSFHLYKLPETGTPPDSRQLAGTALNEKQNKLYVFGGSSEGSFYYDDLWEFDLDKTYWKKITPVSLSRPEARFAFCLFSDSENGLIYLFGGESSLGCLNDMWAYSAKIMTWTKLTTQGVPAPAFSRFAYITYRDVNNSLKLVVTHGETMSGPEQNVYM